MLFRSGCIEKVNTVIDAAYEYDLFSIWRQECDGIDGIEVSYDQNGEPIS